MRRRVTVPVVGTMVAMVGLLIGVFPTRALLEQRRALDRSEARLEAVDEQNDVLDDRVEALGTDAEIERIAREQYNLVYPGEEAYGLLPATPPPPVVPDAWPFRNLALAMAGQSATP